ncbi:hypothetical protein [Bradyrhizobium australafricanum]|uniref:hypothetical protein n=1 Tax=Bradyrhizobium australafricanum TaxID=2821406 RepID=UPI001CE30406|nr:hypothetical protein [Bradyrhizobium australafricanum]MCA6103930.1 hypothetical protein [Bradyrhizobium australafricanum]
MSRPGPKGKPPELKVISGTDQPVRRRERVVSVLDGQPVKPAWLKGRAAKLWAEKVATYADRGQSVTGCESALAQYCSLEASLIEQFVKKLTPPTSQLSAYRTYAAEFFDTPASQIGSPKQPKAGKFAGNGQPPQGELASQPETKPDA